MQQQLLPRHPAEDFAETCLVTLSVALRRRLKADHIRVKRLSRLSGISANSIWRILAGHNASLQTFFQLLYALDIPQDRVRQALRQLLGLEVEA